MVEVDVDVNVPMDVDLIRQSRASRLVVDDCATIFLKCQKSTELAIEVEVVVDVDVDIINAILTCPADFECPQLPRARPPTGLFIYIYCSSVNEVSRPCRRPLDLIKLVMLTWSR